MKIKTSAIWKPAIFNHKQVLKKGEIDTFYFNRLNSLNFSWGEYDSINDFKASCKIDLISHKIYGEIHSVQSTGNEFIIKGVKIDKKINLNEMNEDTEKWNLRIELSEFIKLPKRNY